MRTASLGGFSFLSESTLRQATSAVKNEVKRVRCRRGWRMPSPLGPKLAKPQMHRPLEAGTPKLNEKLRTKHVK